MTRKRRSGDPQGEAESRKELELQEQQFRADLRSLLGDARFVRFWEALRLEFGFLSNECHEATGRQYFRDGQKSVGHWLMERMLETQSPEVPEPPTPKEGNEESNDGE